MTDHNKSRKQANTDDSVDATGTGPLDFQRDVVIAKSGFPEVRYRSAAQREEDLGTATLEHRDSGTAMRDLMSMFMVQPKPGLSMAKAELDFDVVPQEKKASTKMADIVGRVIHAGDIVPLPAKPEVTTPVFPATHAVVSKVAEQAPAPVVAVKKAVTAPEIVTPVVKAQETPDVIVVPVATPQAAAPAPFIPAPASSGVFEQLAFRDMTIDQVVDLGVIKVKALKAKTAVDNAQAKKLRNVKRALAASILFTPSEAPIPEGAKVPKAADPVGARDTLAELLGMKAQDSAMNIVSALVDGHDDASVDGPSA